MPFGKAVALGLLIGLVGVVVSLTPAGMEFENEFDLHWLFTLRGPVEAPPDVVVVAIDESAARALELPSKPSEWPRQLHARLLRALADAHPAVIVFDLTFDTPYRESQQDEEFAAAIRDAGSVVLAESLRRETVLAGSDSSGIQGFVVDRRFAPIEPLEQAAAGIAVFALPKASRIDSYWAFMTAGVSLPAMALHFYARSVQERFVSLWQQAAGPLSAPSAVAGSSRQVESEMKAIRQTVRSNPTAAETIAKSLATNIDVESDRRARRLLTALLRMYAGEDERYLNFYGPPRTVTTISYHELLRATSIATERPVGALRERLSGKAVFVGYSAATVSAQDRVRDDYNTVYLGPGGLHMSGVEMAATAFANLLDGSELRPLSAPWHLAAILLWGFWFGLASWTLRPSLAAFAVAFLIGLYLLVALRLFSVDALVLPLVIPIALQAPLALFTGALLHYREARRGREAIKRAFSSFLPSTVVDQLAKGIGPATSPNQLLYGACLSTDVERYSAISEELGPQELAELMNEYYAEIFKPVAQRNGYVSDIVGDAMLAVWASSTNDSSLRRNACHAALDISEAVDRFNRDVKGRPELRTRIGLHFGELVLGTIGSAQHYEYRAVGDMVNAATRIEGLNKYLGTWVLASQATIDGVSDLIVRPVGSFVFVGKSKPLRVCEVLGRADEKAVSLAAICERFAIAFASYDAGRFADGAKQFSEILKSQPHDGPSRFYLTRCQQLAADPPSGVWDPTVWLGGK